MSTTSTGTPASKDLVLSAIEQLLGQRDTSALDSFFSPMQHSTATQDGLQGHSRTDIQPARRRGIGVGRPEH